ncbi:hypothetical protein KPL37_08720 [Clostridium frigoris]|uniref:Uncharacterized protein n=1 Tax=Clostridium frigoris TaxID=205327 RepID=A0ABS6BSC9_9CLOT|nr:hypothetical protein [Clostridium frigoris]MBU3159833.1 hypothetical protein [Clostridium frigoris]
MNKKITSTALAALMIAGSTSFSAFAAMADGTVVIGTKAYDMAYANDPANATEITAAIVAGGTVYFKDFNGNWVDNVTGAAINASVIPAVTYTNASGTTQIGAGDATTSEATSATATNVTAKSFKVTFNGSVTDTSKVVFTVKQGSALVKTMTTTWNAAKTEATLTNESNLPAGVYTVNTMNGTADFGTSTITLAQQKVAKIEITSTKLGVNNTKSTGATDFGKGYATYKVFDQYGADITTSSLANSITFQTGVGSIDGKDGVITITPSMSILQFNSVVITAYDSTSGVNTSATLTVTSQTGTLSDINLTALTNADGKVLTAQDTSTLFYVDYTATDISGNPTKNYDLVKNGLILNDNTDELTATNSYITTKVVHDPSDSNKAAIQVQVKNATDSLSMDIPLIITAMTYTGKSSTLNVTLKKEAKIDKITLQSPAYNIAIGEDKEIPFVALDQNGKVLTKYSDIASAVGVSISGAHWYKNADGTCSLRAGDDENGYPTDGQRVVTATTQTGNYSSITINVQKKVAADSLSLDTAQFKTIFQQAATQKMDFGYDKGGLTVKDQYDRIVDMTTGTKTTGSDNSQYYVIATSSDASKVAVTTKNGTAQNAISTGQQQIILTAGTAGTATVTFKLYNKDTTKTDGTVRDPLVAVDTQTQTFTVLDNKDIKDYVIESVPNPIYADIAVGGTVTNSRQEDYKANPEVFGTTSSGAKVKLAGTPITGSSVSNNTDFVIFNKTGASDDVKVAARKLVDPAKTGATTTLTVNVLGADSEMHPVTTTITSSTVDPEAKSIAINAETEVKGIDRTNDTITLTESAGVTYNSLLGTNKDGEFKSIFGSLAAYDENGVQKGSKNVYISATDQYGQDSMALSQFSVVQSGIDSTGKYASRTELNGHTFTIDNYGTITKNTAKAGDYVTVTGITTNGLMKTIRINFGVSTVVSSDPTIAANAAISNANTAESAYKLAGGSDAAAVYTAVTSASAVLTTKLAASPVTETTKAAIVSQTKVLTDAVVALNDATVVITPLAAVNNAANAAAMKTALENTALKLDLTVYNKLSNADKLVVAEKIWGGIKSPGFASATDVQNALDAIVKVEDTATAAVVKAETSKLLADQTAANTLVEKLPAGAVKTDLTTRLGKIVVLTPAEMSAATVAEFDANLLKNGSTLLGGSVDNTAKEITITDASKTADTGVFAKLDALNITSVKIGDTVVDLSDKVAAKTLVTNYFMKNGLTKATPIIITVTGTNGSVEALNYTLLAMK